MSPRAYRLGERQAQVDETRERIVGAARVLLSGADVGGFSMEAVARAARVARMTVYYQFGSKAGLLEAVCDVLAMAGGMDALGGAFGQPTLQAGLDEFIRVFGRFWDADRVTTRRLRALAALDEEFARVIRARDDRRRQALTALVSRFGGHKQPGREAPAELVEILFALLSFESFDTLAGPTRSCGEVVPQIQRVARATVASYLAE
jgi:AcrR family transcriptional regulator